MDQAPEPFAERLRRLLGTFAPDHGFSAEVKDDEPRSLRAWARLESGTIVIDVIRDRGEEWVTVMAKERPRPRALRRAWSLGHVVAYLDGASAPYPVSDLEVELGWLARRAAEILDPEMLNSEGLRRWAVKASRRRFGRRPGD
jgi:hypothetical protein